MKQRSSGFPTRSHTNRVVIPHKMTRGLKFRIQKVGESYYLCSENKDTDQLRSYSCVFVFAYAKSWFSHNEAQLLFFYFWCWDSSFNCGTTLSFPSSYS